MTLDFVSNEDLRRRTVELRASDTEEGVVVGYVTTFDQPYAIGRSTQEVITRSTFDLSRPVPLFLEHAWSAGPIGASRSLVADGKGIKAEFELFLDDPRARNIWRAMKRGAFREYSIGFIAADDAITRSRSGDDNVETITKGDLVEVSVVVRGANPHTETVSVRAVPPMPAAPGVAPTHPAQGMPGVDPAVNGLADPEDEPPTKAGLMSEVAELVEMATELHMVDQLVKIVQTYIKLLADSTPAAPAVHDPNAPVPPGHPAPPPPPPAGRSQAYVSPALLRALGGSI